MPVVMVVGAGPVPGLGLYEASEDEFRALFADRRLVFAEDVLAEGVADRQAATDEEEPGLAALGLWARPLAAGSPVTVDGVLLHGFATRRRAVEATWREGSAGAPAWAAPSSPRRPVPAEGRRSLVPVVLIWVLVLGVAAWWYAHRG